MRKKNELSAALVPLVITFSIYLVFYSRISSKPNQAGFWLILAMGMAIGVFLTRLFSGTKTGDKEDK